MLDLSLTGILSIREKLSKLSSSLRLKLTETDGSALVTILLAPKQATQQFRNAYGTGGNLQ